MMCLWVMVVVMVGWSCVGTEGRWPASQTLDSELDSLLCSPTNYPGYIIDIHESMSKGAELLDGVLAKNLATCMSGCCKTRGCDLALYKNEGVSKTGKNCYYVQCGLLDNCVLVEHASFTSVSFLQALPKTVSTTPPTTATPTVMSATKATPTVMSATKATPTVMSATPTSVTPAMPTTTPPTVAPSTPSATPSSATSASTGGPKSMPPSPDSQNKSKAKAEAPVDVDSNNADCGKYGCDGSGVVAVVVVGVICFAIVLVVVAILLKKVVDDRRKRKFRNVDYLINGMYT